MNEINNGIRVWIEYTTATGQDCKRIRFDNGTSIRQALDTLAAESFQETNVQVENFSTSQGILKAKENYRMGRVFHERTVKDGEFLPAALYVANHNGKSRVYDDKAAAVEQRINRNA